MDLLLMPDPCPLSSGRTRLPNRRPAVVETLRWLGRTWLLGVGFDGEGKIREVFLDGPKIGSDAAALLDDGCVLMSLLLQHGVDVAELDRHLGREGVTPDASAASPLGHIAASLARLEADCGLLMGAAVRARETGCWPEPETIDGQ